MRDPDQPERAPHRLVRRQSEIDAPHAKRERIAAAVDHEADGEGAVVGTGGGRCVMRQLNDLPSGLTWQPTRLPIGRVEVATSLPFAPTNEGAVR